MNLKRLIQTLLSTRTTQKEAAVATLPKQEQYSSGTCSGWTKTLISPVDGWVTSSGKGGCFLSAVNSVSNSCFSNATAGANASVPVQKGQTVTIGSDGSQTYKFIEFMRGVINLVKSLFAKEVSYVY